MCCTPVQSPVAEAKCYASLHGLAHIQIVNKQACSMRTRVVLQFEAAPRSEAAVVRRDLYATGLVLYSQLLVSCQQVGLAAVLLCGAGRVANAGGAQVNLQVLLAPQLSQHADLLGCDVVRDAGAAIHLQGSCHQ
jgi:hypothetical protein